MGCGSSKQVSDQIENRNLCKNGDYSHHKVFLTSSTYGALKLDRETDEIQPPPAEAMVELKNSNKIGQEPPEIINTSEIMQGIESELPAAVQSEKGSKFRVTLKENKIASPRKTKKKQKTAGNGGIRVPENIPRPIFKERNSLPENPKKSPSPKLWVSSVIKNGSTTPDGEKCLDLFDPETIQSFRKHFAGENYEIKKIVSSSLSVPNSPNNPTPRRSKTPKTPNSILNHYPLKTPPGGDNAVVIYTTTLRGIRKTFDDCNTVRSILESQNVRVLERDVSMHLGYLEELRLLVGREAARVPVVFVKGRLIGGASEVVRLEEGGKFGVLMEGIPVARDRNCSGCGGVRFVVCGKCHGSCRVVGMDGWKNGKCKECNENGLVVCPLCN